MGLNVFFNQFAQQFPDILGIRIQDPMLGGKGVAPLTTTFNSMIQQADTGTATAVGHERRDDGGPAGGGGEGGEPGRAQVPVGRGLPPRLPDLRGAGRRRATTSGSPAAPTPTGVLVGADGQPIAGEFMWKSECRPKTAAEQTFQPHYETITRQDQAQIYQELIRDPRGRLTTSFLSLADVVKDNRLLPRGWTPTVELARSEGLGSAKLSAEALVRRVLPDLPDGHGGEVHDPWYEPKSKGGLGGGGDAITYAIPLADLKGTPASVRVTLYYQSIPPSYLQDRFCTTPAQPDTSRLFFVAGHTNLDEHAGRGVEAAGGVERTGGGGGDGGRFEGREPEGGPWREVTRLVDAARRHLQGCRRFRMLGREDRRTDMKKSGILLAVLALAAFSLRPLPRRLRPDGAGSGSRRPGASAGGPSSELPDRPSDPDAGGGEGPGQRDRVAGCLDGGDLPVQAQH